MHGAHSADRRLPPELPGHRTCATRGRRVHGRRRCARRSRGAEPRGRAPPGDRPSRRPAPRPERIRGRCAAARSEWGVTVDRARLEPRRRRLRRPDRRERRPRVRAQGRADRRGCPRAGRLSRRVVELVFVSTVAIVEAVVAGLLITRSHQEGAGVVTGMAAIGAGLSFVVSGLIALHRRPENKTGLYLAAVGYLWLLGSLASANSSAVFTVGQWISGFAFVPFAALLLSFPTGRLDRPSRTIVRLTAIYVVVGPVI